MVAHRPLGYRNWIGYGPLGDEVAGIVLMARVDVFGGSTGWHRAWLIDTAVKHFSEWWLLGIKNSGVWDPLLADVTNQYLVEGFDGGRWFRWCSLS